LLRRAESVHHTNHVAREREGTIQESTPNQREGGRARTGRSPQTFRDTIMDSPRCLSGKPGVGREAMDRDANATGVLDEWKHHVAREALGEDAALREELVDRPHELARRGAHKVGVPSHRQARGFEWVPR